MSPRHAPKLMAAGGGALMVLGFAAMAYLEPMITNAAEQGFKDGQGVWLGWEDYGLMFILIGGLFLVVYSFVTAQSHSAQANIVKSRANAAAAAA